MATNFFPEFGTFSKMVDVVGRIILPAFVGSICIVLACPSVDGLENGLGRTPPMGWLAWERFRCNTNCTHDPRNCISEKLFMKMADIMASEGYMDVGYEYVIMDDCWAAKKRDKYDRIQPDPDRFPSGIKALADYIHSKGLKLGIYGDYGKHTCAGYPGMQYHMEIDAQTYADWGIDFLKVDNCASNPHQFKDGYPPIAFWLNKTGRPILLGCEYARYQILGHVQPNYTQIANACNIGRNYLDMQDSWSCVSDVINYYGNDNGKFSEEARPGYFNDPDVLILGNFGLSEEQQSTQIAMWAILAAPFIMSNDLREINSFSKSLLLNQRVISVNQDKLGTQGKRVFTETHLRAEISVWTKPVLPDGSVAFVFINIGEWGAPIEFNCPLSKLGLNKRMGYEISNIFTGQEIGFKEPGDSISVYLNPSGSFFGKATPFN